MSLFSVWLVPRASPVKTCLSETIQHFSTKLNAPNFPPHCTLVGDTKADAADTVAGAKLISSKLKAGAPNAVLKNTSGVARHWLGIWLVQKFYIRFPDVSTSSTYFQCVFLLCEKGPEILEAYQLAKDTYGLAEAPPFMPHVSLLYSDIDAKSRGAEAIGARNSLFSEMSEYRLLSKDPGFWAEDLEVWSVDIQDKSLQSWKKIAEFELQWLLPCNSLLVQMN